MKTISAACCLTALMCLILFSGCSSGTPGTTTPTVVTPTVASISPAKLPAGSPDTTLTVTGTGFLSSSTIQVGGVLETTTLTSSTQVSAAIPAAQLAGGAMLNVIASNGSASSASGAAVTLEVDNPAPTITQFLPSTLATGTAGATLALTGTGFVPATAIQVNAAARSTSFVNATQVNVAVTSADLAAAGTLSLTAVNPTPGGGTSAAASLPVNNPVPGPITLKPSTLPTGATTATTITVTGSNFLSSSTVQIGTTARATTFVSASQLTFQLTVAEQATNARLLVSVVTPPPGGGTSTTAFLTLAAPTPTPVLSHVSPSQFVVGSGATFLNVLGTNFTSESVVLWNGNPLNTIYVTVSPGAYLLAQVPASLTAATGTASITVTSPTAVVPLSNVLPVTVVNPPAPTLTYLSPDNGPIHTASYVTLSGTGFTTNSTVAYNGSNLTTTYISSTRLSVILPAASLPVIGNGSFTVTTPAPGGGTTAPLVFTAYLGIANNSMVYNPVSGLLYISVPSSAGAPYGNSVVSVDPATGALGTPIPVGSEPNRLALTSDGKFLWVGLDGAAAVRKVDLTAGTAGLQFTLGGNTGIYASPGTAYALAALPGATDSVVVGASQGYSPFVAIYDNGVRRGTGVSTYSGNYAYALQVDGSRNEIYAAGSSSYIVYTYSATGLTLKTTATNGTYAASNADDLQVAGGRAYTDFGQVFDAEAGNLLGTFYNSGTTVASGPVTVDTTLAKVFILDTPPNTSTGISQVQVFSATDFTLGANVIPVNATYTSAYSGVASHLTLWGTNGLAFRTLDGVFSLRSNFVKDLSSTSADLSLTLSATGTNATGQNTTYLATVSNAGPAAATNVALVAFLPSTASLVSATPSAGTCSTSGGLSCDLGSLASGTSATVTLVATQTTAGSSTLTAQVSASENDPNTANNQASSTLTVSGSAYNLAPTLTAISPATILVGASDTVLTLTGSGFTGTSSVLLNGTPLSTTFTNSTTLSATVPAASLTALGWAPVTVSTAAPGGGTSVPLPLSIYSVITLGLNHMLYDPFTRKIMASVGSGSSAITGNSIVAITPETSAVGTPVSIGSQPEQLALTSDGQILYTVLSGSQSVARFNMLTQKADFTYAIPSNTSTFGGIALRGIAAQPGTENTIALDLGTNSGNALYDFNPTTQTAAIRGQATGAYTGSCLHFLDSTNLLAFDIDTTGYTLDHYTITAAGFTYYNYSQFTESTLNQFGCFKVDGGLAFSNVGGVANPAPSPAVQLGVFSVPSGYNAGQATVAPDTSLRRTFFAVNNNSTNYNSTVNAIMAFDNTTLLSSATLPLDLTATEGANTSASIVDFIRWGQDGLALLSSGGHVYLLRGAAIVPQLLAQNTAATLSALSSSTLTHGAGNTLLTLTGTHFVPGVAVSFNGAYRTTTILDPTHLSVALPATDLATAGTATLAATNPGAPVSSNLTLTIN